ncbi:hypothetical protein HKCCE2091_15155 [Rhodobacterales bacterium HKCCE2091]|nr:hypothetical protein [Rhodobacterales bacterium HKCCE2091]
MPILATLAAIGLTALFWVTRARLAADAISDLADLFGRGLGAIRRARFRARAEVHPVDAVEDPGLAAGTLAHAFLALGPALTVEARIEHVRAMQTHLGLHLGDAEEILALGDWFIGECGGPAPAVDRIARRLRRIGGPEALDPALRIASAVAARTGGLTDAQRDALARLRRVFGR